MKHLTGDLTGDKSGFLGHIPKTGKNLDNGTELLSSNQKGGLTSPPFWLDYNPQSAQVSGLRF